MTTLTIEIAMVSDEDTIVDTLVLAFSADPAARWLYSDPHQYLIHFPTFVRTFAGKAFEQGSAYYVENYTGAALWLAPDVHPDEDALSVLLKHTIAERDREEAFAVFEQMDNYHPNEPHWYLPLIGVDPSQQRKGCGSALMQHALMSCDRDKKLAYLESTSATSITLYKRQGFELLGIIQVGVSPPIFPMIRKPQ